MKKSKYPKPEFVAIEGKQLTPSQRVYFSAYFKEHGIIPGNKIVCTKTGKLTTCQGSWRDKKITEFGGIENLLAKYVSKRQRQQISKTSAVKVKKSSKEKTKSSKDKSPKKEKVVKEKKTRTPRKKKAKVKSQRAIELERKENLKNNIPAFRQSPPRSLNKLELAEITKTTCLRPDIFLNNGRHCVGCLHFEYCSCRIKNLPKGMFYENGEFVEH